MKYKCVLFDLDGTLTDPAEGIFRCFRLGLAHLGLSEPVDDDLNKIIGPPLFNSYTEYYGLSKEQALEAMDVYRREYNTKGLFENKPYDGVLEMLKTLHDAGIMVLTATSKPELFSYRIVERFGLLPYIDHVCGASMDDSRSSKEAVMEYALSFATQFNKSEILMVGDRKFDLIGAAFHGIAGAGVLYGYGTRHELSSCPNVFLANTPAELCDYIINFGGINMKDIRELRQYVRSTPWDDSIVSDQNKDIPAPPITTPVPENAVKIALPDPRSCAVAGNTLLDDIVERRSCRAYAKTPLTLNELSFLLYCTNGFKQMRDHSAFATLRTVPSAGARHPIETYLAVMNVEGLKCGIYRFLPLTHELYFISEKSSTLADEINDAVNGQIFAGTAPVTFFWAVDMYRCEWRYPDHAYKVVMLDVGHICQNLYLACQEIGCGCCAIAAYDQEKSDALFELNGDNDFVIYVAPVGKTK